MKDGVILFRGSGADARRYLESDRSRADEYYLEGGTSLAEFSVVDRGGEVIGEGALTPNQYAQWVDWINPLTGESMGKPRLPGDDRHGSPRFAEMVVNAPKSLSIAAALHPEVSVALDAAQRDAVAAIRAWLGQHSVTRVGPRGSQRVYRSSNWRPSASRTRPHAPATRTDTSTSRSGRECGQPTHGAVSTPRQCSDSRARSVRWAQPSSRRTRRSRPPSTPTVSLSIL